MLVLLKTALTSYDYHPESPLDGIPTGWNPHWTEFPPGVHVSVGIQYSGDYGHLVTESPPDFCSC